MFKPRQLLLRSIVALVPLLVLLGCGSASSTTTTSSASPGSPAKASAFPVTIAAANGRVRVPSRPTAIISLSPTATEMLYAIGAGPQVKAVDEFSDYPADAPRTKLDGLEPNVEAIASYKPDLVVVSDDPPSLNHQLSALGIPLLEEPGADNLSQEYEQFLQLGEATGNLKAAEAEVASIKSKIAHIVAGAPKLTHPETYYYELDQTYYSATSTTFIGQLLGLLGLRSIADAAKGAASRGGYPQLSAEFILKANPDYIFLADTICCHQSAATVAARPGWSVLAAVKDHRILGLNDDIASRWGPRVVILLRDVADEIEQHRIPGS